MVRSHMMIHHGRVTTGRDLWTKQGFVNSSISFVGEYT